MNKKNTVYFLMIVLICAASVSASLTDLITGGVSRFFGLNVSNKFMTVDPWIDVRYYGAKGDGVTDDTGAIQNAINAASGKEVYLPCGNYNTTGRLNLTNSTTLRGAGYCTTLHGWGGAAQVIYAYHVSNIEIHNFNIDLHNNTGGVLISGSNHFRVHDMFIRNVSGTAGTLHCLDLNGASSIGWVYNIEGEQCSDDLVAIGGYTNHIFVTNTYGHDFVDPFAGASCVEVDGGGSEVIATGNMCRNTVDYAFDMKFHAGEDGAKNCIFTGNMAEGSDYGFAATQVTSPGLSRNDGLVLANNLFRYSGSKGISIAYTDNSVVANNLLMGNEYQLYLAGNTNNTVVSGNVISEQYNLTAYSNIMGSFNAGSIYVTVNDSSVFIPGMNIRVYNGSSSQSTIIKYISGNDIYLETPTTYKNNGSLGATVYRRISQNGIRDQGGNSNLVISGNAISNNITTRYKWDSNAQSSMATTLASSTNPIANSTYIITGGYLGINTTAPTADLDVAGSTLRLRDSRCTGTCSAGMISWNASAICVCTATNTWETTAIA